MKLLPLCNWNIIMENRNVVYVCNEALYCHSYSALASELLEFLVSVHAPLCSDNYCALFT